MSGSSAEHQSEREKMLSGRLYRASDPELTAARISARRQTAAYNATDPGAGDERLRLLRGFLGHVGDGVVVETPFHCDYGWNIAIGDGVYINVRCVVLDCAPVTIGARSLLGPGVQLCAATHPLDPDERERELEHAGPITIGTNVWIATGVIVGPGVTIGDNSVIGAGSVVLRDVPENVLAAGNPLRIVRRL